MNSVRAPIFLLVCAAFGAGTIANENGCAQLPEISFVDAGLLATTEDGAVVGTSSVPSPPVAASDASAATDPEDATVVGDVDAGAPLPPVMSSGGPGAPTVSSSGGGAPAPGSSSGGAMPGPTAEAGPPSPLGSCPWRTPPGAQACCDNVPCVGMKCADRCFECIACATAGFCCVPNGDGVAVTCAATATACGP